MKEILLFGAGKSATCLIDYLLDESAKNHWKLTVCDANLEAAQSKIGDAIFAEAVSVNVEHEEQRGELIQRADVVISLLPPSLHYLIALDCIKYSRHLLTASYIDDKIRGLAGQVEEKNILFLAEMGLDPGIDHMSAMKLIDDIRESGGIITSFKSHCGGLVAPESDDNPWRYKISWNPRNVVLAGKNGAVYIENGQEKHERYEELFQATRGIEIEQLGFLSYYPNRDSSAYIDIYNLHDATTFMRTTLRYPEFCYGWKNLIELKLTDETPEYNTEGMRLREFFKLHFDKNNFAEWLKESMNQRLSFSKDLLEKLVQLQETAEELKKEAAIRGEDLDSINNFMVVDEKGDLKDVGLDEVKNTAANAVMMKLQEANLAIKQLMFLGMDSDEYINKGLCSAADVLQFALERKLALTERDKDMIVMLHEIEYELPSEADKKYGVKSQLIVIGEDNVRTAMAKTVGLPLGIAAKLILNGEMNLRGLQIPIIPDIYNPVLRELEKHEITFKEKITQL
jgi:saccharopine dehydrogenase-like NADP-dependent oxidoreductase